MKKTFEQELVAYLLSVLNNNEDEIFFNASLFIQRTDEKYEIIDHPTFNTVTVKEYIPVMFDMSPEELNIKGRDANSWNLTMNYALTALQQGDPYLQKQINAIEKFRVESNKNPINEIKINDVLYQIYNDNENTGEVPLEWEANTEYTILANVLSYNDLLGYTVVDGFQIDALAVNIPAGTTGVFKQAFTTGSNPTNAHKQFLTPDGQGGIVLIRTAVVLGDKTGISDEEAINIIENKSPTLENLINNNQEFAHWTTQDFDTLYTTLNYRYKVSVNKLIPVGPIQVQDARQRILCIQNIPLESGINLYFGEETVFELKKDGVFEYTELVSASEKGYNETPTYKPVHFYGDQKASNFVESSAAKGRFTILFDPDNPMHVDLYDRAIGENSPTAIYDLRMTLPYDNNKQVERKILLEVLPVMDTGAKKFITGVITNATS